MLQSPLMYFNAEWRIPCWYLDQHSDCIEVGVEPFVQLVAAAAAAAVEVDSSSGFAGPE